MKKTKKIIIRILIVILIILFILLGYVIYDQYNKDAKTSNKDIQTKEKKSANKVNKNNAETIKQEHCLDNLCITDMEIVEDGDTMKVITGTVTNKSNETIPEGLVELVFNVKGKEIAIKYYYLPVQGKATFPLELQHNNNKVIDADDYKIVKLSEEELLKFKKENEIK